VSQVRPGSLNLPLGPLRSGGSIPRQLEIAIAQNWSGLPDQPDKQAWIESQRKALSSCPLCLGSRSRFPGPRHPLSGFPVPHPRNLCNRLSSGFTGIADTDVVQEWCAKPHRRCAHNEGLVVRLHPSLAARCRGIFFTFFRICVAAMTAVAPARACGQLTAFPLNGHRIARARWHSGYIFLVRAARRVDHTSVPAPASTEADSSQAKDAAVSRPDDAFELATAEGTPGLLGQCGGVFGRPSSE